MFKLSYWVLSKQRFKEFEWLNINELELISQISTLHGLTLFTVLVGDEAASLISLRHKVLRAEYVN